MDLFITRYHALDKTPRYIQDIAWIDTSEKQDYLLSRTVLDEFCIEYPLPPSHVRSLLETVVRTCEFEKLEVSEAVYEQLSMSLSKPKISHQYYGSYTINENLRVAFRTDAADSSAFVREGSTGFCTWEAGKCLAWYLCRERKYNTILELGCGTGVTGIVVSKILGSDYIFTDYHEQTLEQARLNCEINGVAAEFKKVDILRPVADNSISTDVIVAADILYDTDLCRGLVRWLSSNDVYREALIMSTIRTDETYDVFKRELDQHRVGIEWSIVHRLPMSQWIEMAGQQWGPFLDSNKRLFDPVIELVRIVKK